MATAIPPRAAEVASNKVVRQKLLSVAGVRSTAASSTGRELLVSIFGLGKTRRGIGELIKKMGK
jgi:hypothetical protein